MPAEATCVRRGTPPPTDYDGFLRWAYNSWVGGPAPRLAVPHMGLPATPTSSIPGGRSSIRFERLRGGIQDAEKIRILRADPGRGELGRVRTEKRARLEAVIAPFASREPAADLHERLAEAKRVLNEL